MANISGDLGRSEMWFILQGANRARWKPFWCPKDLTHLAPDIVGKA